jgi:MFS family permease
MLSFRPALIAAPRSLPCRDLVRRCRLGERFGAFTYRDYRLVFFGQAVSAVGSWMQMVVQGWLVYSLTGSSLDLGLVALARALPVFIFSLVGGAVADRWDRRRVIALANAAAGLLALALGVLIWLHVVSIWHIIVVAFLSGLAFSFESPCRQALVSDLVEEKDVVSAVGLNSLAFNMAAVIGPSIAGVMIMQMDAGVIFMLNGLSYAAVVATILLTRTGPCAAASKGSILADTLDGLRYVWRAPELFALVGLMVVTSLLARPYNQLLPVFASDVLQIGAAGLAALNVAAGAGAIVAGVLVAALGTFRHRGMFAVLSGVTLGAALIVFALSSSLTASLASAVVLGFCSTYSSISVNTLLQTYTAARMKGRVMGLHGLTMMGMVPVGAMLEGGLGSAWGVPMVLFYGGVATVALTLLITVRGARVHALS